MPLKYGHSKTKKINLSSIPYCSQDGLSKEKNIQVYQGTPLSSLLRHTMAFTSPEDRGQHNPAGSGGAHSDLRNVVLKLCTLLSTLLNFIQSLSYYLNIFLFFQSI